MALTATATQGFEPIGLTTGEEVFYLPGDPGDTFTKGDLVYMNNGVLDVAGDSTADVIGSVVETTVCPAAATGFPNALNHDPVAKASRDLTLVPVKMRVGKGVQIYKATFAGQFDDTVAAYTAATPSLTLTTATGADDDVNGGLIYVYEGTGAGQMNIAADYVNSTKVLTLHRAFDTAISTDSKIIILEGEGSAGDGIGPLGRLDGEDQNNLSVADGEDDGDYVIFMDWASMHDGLAKLYLKVIHASAIYS